MKNTSAVMVILALLLVLPGCSNRGTTNAQEAESSSSGVSFAAQEAGRKLPEHLVISEDVDTTADYKSALPELTVKSKPFDAGKVLAALMPDFSVNDMSATQSELNNGTRFEEYSLVTDTESIFVGYKISYRSENGDFYKKYSPASDSYTAFEKNGELPFESLDEALENVKSILLQAGIENVSLKESYALDYKTLEAMEQEYSQGDGFNDELKAGREIYKGDWSENDDCYFFILRQELNGIPVYEDNYLMSENEIISGTEIFVYYTINGIEALTTNVVYEELSSQTESKLLSAEDAMNLMAAQFEDIILLSDVTITRMELMYVPVSSEETTQMVPAWRFTTVQDVTWESDAGMTTTRQENDYYFNAIDGTELSCSQ